MKSAIACIICCGFARVADADATIQPTTAPGVVATVLSSNHIRLTWPAVSNIDSYRVCRGETPGFVPDYFSEVSPPGLSENQYDDVQRVEEGTTYYYQVYAFPSGDNAPPYYPIVVHEPICLGSVFGTTPGVKPRHPLLRAEDLIDGSVYEDLRRLGLLRLSNATTSS